MPDTSDSPHVWLVLFRRYPTAGTLRERVCTGKCVCPFFKRNCLEVQRFLLPTETLLVFAARRVIGFSIAGENEFFSQGMLQTDVVPLLIRHSSVPVIYAVIQFNVEFQK